MSDRTVAADWRRIDRVIEYETSWYTGGYDLLEQPNGSRKRYYWAALPPAVIVVARTGDELVMVEQYRPPIEHHCLELPAGIVDAKDLPAEALPEEEYADTPGGLAPTATVPPAGYEAAGARELREETGFDPTNTVFLEDFWVATGVLRHKRGIVFASELEASERELDPNEFISVNRVPIDEALDRVRTDPTNESTLEGLLLAEHEGLL